MSPNKQFFSIGLLAISSIWLVVHSEPCLPTEICVIAKDGGGNVPSSVDSSYKYHCTGSGIKRINYAGSSTCSGNGVSIDLPGSELHEDFITCDSCTEYILVTKYGLFDDDYDLGPQCQNKGTQRSQLLVPYGCVPNFITGSNWYNCAKSGGAGGNGYYEQKYYTINLDCTGAPDAPSTLYYDSQYCTVVNDTTHTPIADWFWFEVDACNDGPSGGSVTTPAPVKVPTLKPPTRAPTTRDPTASPHTPGTPTRSPVDPSPTRSPVDPSPTMSPVDPSPTGSPHTPGTPTHAPVIAPTISPSDKPATDSPTRAPLTGTETAEPTQTDSPSRSPLTGTETAVPTTAGDGSSRNYPNILTFVAFYIGYSIFI